jgi:hypothetical protein
MNKHKKTAVIIIIITTTTTTTGITLKGKVIPVLCL